MRKERNSSNDQQSPEKAFNGFSSAAGCELNIRRRLQNTGAKLVFEVGKEQVFPCGPFSKPPPLPPSPSRQCSARERRPQHPGLSRELQVQRQREQNHPLVIQNPQPEPGLAFAEPRCGEAVTALPHCSTPIFLAVDMMFLWCQVYKTSLRLHQVLSPIRSRVSGRQPLLTAAE